MPGDTALAGTLGKPFDPAAGRLSGHIRFAQCKQEGASNSKTPGICPSI